jgi:hypothetical protein
MQPNPFMPTAPQQPQGNPYQQQPVAPAAPANPYQQPQQYAPAAPAQQQYQQPQQQAAPAGNGLVARPGAYSTPPPPSEGGSANMPKVADLQGRLLIIMPERLESGVTGKFGIQDRMTCTVVVLDGGPLSWGGMQPGQQRMTEQVPYVVKGLWISQAKLREQLAEPLAMRLRGEPGLALGRLWKTGTGGNDPYVLAQPSPQDAAMYDQYVSQVNPFAL